MRLVRLSRISIAVCGGGLALLVVLAGLTVQDLSNKRAALEELIDLKERIDHFSAASDSLLVTGADPALWRTFKAEAETIKDRLQPLGRRSGSETSRQIDAIVRTLEAAAVERPLPRSGITNPGTHRGPLALSPRARALMSQVAGHGMALDGALEQALHARRADLAWSAARMTGAFALAALLFGLTCMAAFAIIHRRITGPVRRLEHALHHVENGDLDTRLDDSGNDEFAGLARTFNGMLEARQHAESALQEQTRQLTEHGARLAESQRIARVGSWQLDSPSGELTCSEQTIRILGLDPDQGTPSAERFLECINPADRPTVEQERSRAVREGGRHELQYRITDGRGRCRHVHERGEARTNEAGQVQGLTGTLQDITAEKAFEERLSQYQQLIDASRELYAVTDAQYRYVHTNRAYAERQGLTPATIAGRSVAEVMGRDYFEQVARPALDRCLAGESQIFETDQTLPGGECRRILVRYHPLVSPTDGSRQVGAVVTDVTDFRHAQADLAEQRDLESIAGRMASLGGWSVDLANDTVTWSDVVCQIHDMPAGYTPSVDEAVSFYKPEWQARIRERVRDCAEHGQPFDEVLELTTASGEQRWVRTAGQAVRDPAGTIVKVHGAFQDITERRRTEEERMRLAERLHATVESITDAFFTVDTEWRLDYVNREAERLLHRAGGELAGADVWQAFPGVTGSRLEREARRAMAEQDTVALEEFYAPLGRWFDIRIYPWSGGLTVYFRDTSEHHEMVERLLAQETSLLNSRDELRQALETRQALINSLPATVALVDGDGNVRDVNERWVEFAANGGVDHDPGHPPNYLAVCDQARGEGAADAHAVARGLRAVLAGEQTSFELEYSCPMGQEQRWFRALINPLLPEPGAERGAVVMHIDVTERREAEEALNRLAYEDRLTGVSSRNGFVQTVTRHLEHSGWQPRAAVIMLDIHRQRDINETHGFAAGDDLLVQVARRLASHTPPQTVIGRAGGDEFVVFLPARDDADPAQSREALAGVFARPFTINGTEVDLSARFGYTPLGGQARSAEDLLREAEMALYYDRDARRGDPWAVYTEALEADTQQRITVTDELRRALVNDEFELHFQPKVSLADGQLLAAEALLRWWHPERGLQSPGLFVPIAEQSQLIGPIGDWALNEACRQLRGWQDDGLTVVRVAVNISVVQFAGGDFPETVRRTLTRHGVAAKDLTLEITESVFEAESELLDRQLRELHELGVRLSLDDFGTGYSSLKYLQQYHFDEIKIDKSFVFHLCEDAYSATIVRTVLGIAEALGASVVAEGVESEAVGAALLDLGCEVGQGFHYSLPLASEDFRWLLQRRTTLPLGARPSIDDENGHSQHQRGHGA